MRCLRYKSVRARFDRNPVRPGTESAASPGKGYRHGASIRDCGRMICPRCSTSNRRGASFCDYCGEPLSAEAERIRARDGAMASGTSLLDSGGLVGWMAFDWLARFAVVMVIGFAAGIWTLTSGYYEFSVFFFILGIVGVVGTWYMLNAK